MYNDVARLSSSRAFVTNVLETVNDVRVVNTEYPIVVRVIGIMLKNLIQHRHNCKFHGTFIYNNVLFFF